MSTTNLLADEEAALVDHQEQVRKQMGRTAAGWTALGSPETTTCKHVRVEDAHAEQGTPFGANGCMLGCSFPSVPP